MERMPTPSGSALVRSIACGPSQTGPGLYEIRLNLHGDEYISLSGDYNSEHEARDAAVRLTKLVVSARDNDRCEEWNG